MSQAKRLTESLAVSKPPCTVRICYDSPNKRADNICTPTDPNTSEKAKQNAKDELKEHGIDMV